MTSSRDPAMDRRSGIGFAIGAYGLWGVLPVYFLLLAPSGPVEIVALRVVLSLVFCAILLSVTRGWRAFAAIARNRRLLAAMAIAGLFIVINWLVFVYAALNGQILETSLGYFLNPVVTVLLGVLVLGERLRPLQWASVALVVVAVLVIAIGYGEVPWIALIIAASFALYGFVKKKVGSQVDAISGLTLETAWLTPAAIVTLIVMGSMGGLTLGTAGPGHALLLLGAGVVTAVPLLLFAAASRRLPLTWMGMTQYLAPVLQFLFGAFILQEDMPLERWIGFGLVWVAIIVLSIDMFLSARPRRASVTPA
ncbi:MULTISPECIES: EamA family transporter RarD [unclassified Diaminobutyricimonas]|uniref:EamA family transporter RarD n=1 Tax=unclassified Diaminobutyricimonas TaxID=2643261 RepID=UPI0012F4EC67|nr:MULTISPECIES: EamA family transporter RarD [unclassified Diaminobutyricimonas]